MRAGLALCTLCTSLPKCRTSPGAPCKGSVHALRTLGRQARVNRLPNRAGIRRVATQGSEGGAQPRALPARCALPDGVLEHGCPAAEPPQLRARGSKAQAQIWCPRWVRWCGRAMLTLPAAGCGCTHLINPEPSGRRTPCAWARRSFPHSRHAVDGRSGAGPPSASRATHDTHRRAACKARIGRVQPHAAAAGEGREPWAGLAWRGLHPAACPPPLRQGPRLRQAWKAERRPSCLAHSPMPSSRARSACMPARAQLRGVTSRV